MFFHRYLIPVIIPHIKKTQSEAVSNDKTVYGGQDNHLTIITVRLTDLPVFKIFNPKGFVNFHYNSKFQAGKYFCKIVQIFDYKKKQLLSKQLFLFLQSF
jgi:hypothetical protein